MSPGYLRECAAALQAFSHSQPCNVMNIAVSGYQEGLDLAAVDIMPGQELTYDYGVFAVDSRVDSPLILASNEIHPGNTAFV